MNPDGQSDAPAGAAGGMDGPEGPAGARDFQGGAEVLLVGYVALLLGLGDSLMVLWTARQVPVGLLALNAVLVAVALALVGGAAIVLGLAATRSRERGGHDATGAAASRRPGRAPSVRLVGLVSIPVFAYHLLRARMETETPPGLSILLGLGLLLALAAHLLGRRATGRAGGSGGGPTLRPARLGVIAVVALLSLSAWPYVGGLSAGGARPEAPAGFEGATGGSPPAAGAQDPASPAREPETDLDGAAERPSPIVVLSLDGLRADHLVPYGYGRATSPRLAELSRRSTRFLYAYANSSDPLASHASLLTGLVPHQHGAHTTVAERIRTDAAWKIVLAPSPLDDDLTTLAERLSGLGYETAAFVADGPLFSGGFGLRRGFDRVDDPNGGHAAFEPLAAAPIRRLGTPGMRDALDSLSTRVPPAAEVLSRAAAWLAREREAPAFLYVQLSDARFPYPGAARIDAGATRELDGGEPGPVKEPTTRTEALRAYDRAIRYLDGQVGRFVADLEARDLYDDSLLVVTSAHGTRLDPDRVELGALRPDDPVRGSGLTQAELHVPLLVKWPGQTGSRWIGTPVQLADVVPTIHEMLGIHPLDQPFGFALSAAPRPVLVERFFLSGKRRLRVGALDSEAVSRKAPTVWGLVLENWKFLLRSDGAYGLYDVAAGADDGPNLAERDPETTNDMGWKLGFLLPGEYLPDQIEGKGGS